jgi:hypothetical protein
MSENRFVRDWVPRHRAPFLLARMAAATHGGVQGLQAFDAQYPDEAVWRFEQAKREEPEAFSLDRKGAV